MAKTLSESAAEILKASMSAGKEPMQKMSGEVNDLGGATTDNPGGNEVGKEASADVAEAPKPGTPGGNADAEKKANPVPAGTGGMTGDVPAAVPMSGNKPAPGVKMEEETTEETKDE